MPSKLGPHLMSGGDANRWKAAGARVFKFDPTQLGAAAQVPPGPLVIGKLDQQDNNLNLTDWKAYYNQGWTPLQTAEHRFNAQRNIYVGANKPRVNRYEANPRIDVWEDDNEVVPDNPTEAQWYSRYCIAMMELYGSIGKKRANFSFAVGTPDIKPGDAADIWPHLLPAIRHARDHGHYIALHEYMGYEPFYGVGWSQIDAQRRPLAGRWHGRLAIHEPDESYPYGWAVLRYRFIYDLYLRPEGLADTPLLITECGCDSVETVTPWGVSVGTWKEHRAAWTAEGKDPERHYATMLQWYDRYLREDDYVKGAVVFTVGSVGNWANWDIAGTRVEEALLSYVAAEREKGDSPVEQTPQWVAGTDVSKWQKTINWQKMKGRGVEFVFIRSSYGLVVDEMLHVNAPGALAAGLPYGFYHYYHPWQDAIQQAELVAQQVEKYGIDLPVALDLEDNSGVTADLSNQVLRFLQHLEGRLSAMGIQRRPIIYTSAGYWRSALKSPSWGAGYDLWIAAWTSAAQPAVPAPWNNWTFWQWNVDRNGGPDYGVQSAAIDLNRWHGSAADLQAYLIPRQLEQPPKPGKMPLQALWEAGKGSQLVGRNPGFALERAMVSRFFHPLGPEVRATIDGVVYALQIGGNKKGEERVFYTRDGEWSNIRWTNGQVSPQKPISLPAAEPPKEEPKPPATPAPTPPPAAKKIDLLPYLKGDGRQYVVRHPGGAQEDFQVQAEGDKFWLVKNSQYEMFRYDEAFIWRGVDTSPGPAPTYAERPGHLRYYRQAESGQQWARWCPRWMEVGQTWKGPGHWVQFYWKDDCKQSAANSGADQNQITLVAHHAFKVWNGVHVNDVVELRAKNGERFFFARGFGLVAWSAEWGESAIVEISPAGRSPLKRETINCL